jgi:hypothetical protein
MLSREVMAERREGKHAEVRDWALVGEKRFACKMLQRMFV